MGGLISFSILLASAVQPSMMFNDGWSLAHVIKSFQLELPLKITGAIFLIGLALGIWGLLEKSNP